MRLIYNGVDVARFTPRTGGDDDTPPFILVVGRLSEQKGQDIAVRAFARARARDVRLRLVGEGPERARLEHLVDQLGVGERVDFVGKSDALDHLRACQLVVVPSRWEGLSLLVLEAMATGCAVIATQRGGEEALGPTGWVVSDDDPVQDIATAIDALLADRGRRTALGEAARRRVIERFTLDQCLLDHLALWASLRAES
jgi:glycosyltransferase involved in cell wall biosynthesis